MHFHENLPLVKKKLCFLYKLSVSDQQLHQITLFLPFLLHFQADLPLVDGSYEWAGGRKVEVYDSTVVALHTDCQGIVG